MDKKELLDICFKPGDPVFYEGKAYQIKTPLTLEKVLLVDEATQNTITAKLSELSVYNTTSSLNKNETTSFEHYELAQIPEKIWQLAKQRKAIIHPLAIGTCRRVQAQAAAEKLNLSERQVYKLIKRYRNSNFQLQVLIPGKRTGGKGKGRLSQEIEAIIRSAIDDIYLTKQQIKISAVTEEVRRRCYYANLKPPCDHAIRKRIYILSGKEIITKRRNAKEAQCFTPIISSTPVPAYPLAIVQMDHTLVDVMLVDEYLRKPIGRPYLTVAIDVYSRTILVFV